MYLGHGKQLILFDDNKKFLHICVIDAVLYIHHNKSNISKKIIVPFCCFLFDTIGQYRSTQPFVECDVTFSKNSEYDLNISLSF